MLASESLPNRLKQLRQERGWSQADLAQEAGISRPAVSSIENHRLIPSVAAAMSLARALRCPVEELFGQAADRAESGPVWAWPAEPTELEAGRYWHAKVGKRTLLYPVEMTPSGVLEHDGICRGGALESRSRFSAEQTLVVACCDPAAGLLASEIERLTGLRVIILPRSSQQAITLLGAGLVHVAGIHFATTESPDENRKAVRERIDGSFSLLRVARWQEGLALSRNVAVHSISEALAAKLRWVGRQAGSGARNCQDELLENRPAPKNLAKDHRGVGEAIRSGWAEAGICVRLASEEAGLRFISIREEIYELCFATEFEDDPRIRALKNAIRAKSYSKLLADLPGYDSAECGELQRVG
ncbi:MAG: periplasmic molybdate-binding protein/domain protein [Planctomycetaceae bacterium]|nr:periplasmic molybdate-binding protein/domain protein [Planctomycetaceae bacterium]